MKIYLEKLKKILLNNLLIKDFYNKKQFLY